MIINKKSARRNDPCPCGSGLKYKKCCLNASGQQADNVTLVSGLSSSNGQGIAVPQTLRREPVKVDVSPTFSNEINTDLRSILDDHEFESLEQAQAFVSQYMNKRNSTSLPEFHGLSPEQMYSIINLPTDSPLFISLPEDYRVDLNIPFVLFFNELLAAVGNKNFKPTATGNLPRNFCRAVALKYWGEEQYAIKTRFGNINSETDFSELNAFRHTCEVAGYLRKYNGKYIIGKQCQKLMSSGGLSAVHRGLFNTFNSEFNWGFTDRYPDLLLIQHSWAFSIYLLQQHGNQWKQARFYEDAFLEAFPDTIDTIPEPSWTTREDLIKSCYRYRVITHWMCWFGLAEVEDLDSKNPLSKNIRIRKTPLADEIVIFDI